VQVSQLHTQLQHSNKVKQQLAGQWAAAQQVLNRHQARLGPLLDMLAFIIKHRRQHLLGLHKAVVDQGPDAQAWADLLIDLMEVLRGSAEAGWELREGGCGASTRSACAVTQVTCRVCCHSEDCH
jgi:hypothetical protein